MTLVLKQMDETSKEYKEAWESILAAFEKDFGLFTETNHIISMNVKETPRFTHQFQMESESLPLSMLGVWSYAVMDMRLVMNIYFNKEEQTLTASPNFHYEHPGGGRNGHFISNFGESNTRFVYSLESKTLEIEPSNYELHQLVEDLHRMTSKFKETMNEEEQTEYEMFENIHVEQYGRMTEKETRDVVHCLRYYIDKLTVWHEENRKMPYSSRSLGETLQVSKNMMEKLRNRM